MQRVSCVCAARGSCSVRRNIESMTASGAPRSAVTSWTPLGPNASAAAIPRHSAIPPVAPRECAAHPRPAVAAKTGQFRRARTVHSTCLDVRPLRNLVRSRHPSRRLRCALASSTVVAEPHRKMPAFFDAAHAAAGGRPKWKLAAAAASARAYSTWRRRNGGGGGRSGASKRRSVARYGARRACAAGQR